MRARLSRFADLRSVDVTALRVKNMSQPFKIAGGILVGFVAALGVVALSAEFDGRAFDGSAETKAALTWMGNPNVSDQLSTVLGSNDQKELERRDWQPVIEAKER